MTTDIEKITAEYIGLKWQGTIESADLICMRLAWLKPFWDISYNPFRKDALLELTIYETTPGMDSKSWRLKPGDLLACEEEDDRLVPRSVVSRREQKNL